MVVDAGPRNAEGAAPGRAPRLGEGTIFSVALAVVPPPGAQSPCRVFSAGFGAPGSFISSDCPPCFWPKVGARCDVDERLGYTVYGRALVAMAAVWKPSIESAEQVCVFAGARQDQAKDLAKSRRSANLARILVQ